MPQKPQLHGAASIASQAGRRYFATVYDQHKSPRWPNGRPFWGSRELAANNGDTAGFCTVLSPGEYVATGPDDPVLHQPSQTEEDRQASLGSAWDAPWLPAQNGGKNPFFDISYSRMRITWRYDRVILEWRQAHDRYYRAANKIAHQNGWPETERGKVPRAAIVDIIGEPQLSTRIPEAAQAGDPWLLGQTDHVNEALAALLGYQVVSVEKENRWEQDQDFGVRLREKPQAPLTPEAVLAAPSADALATLIAQAVAASVPNAVKAALDAEKQANRDRMAHVRSSKKGKPSPTATAA